MSLHDIPDSWDVSEETPYYRLNASGKKIRYDRKDGEFTAFISSDDEPDGRVMYSVKVFNSSNELEEYPPKVEDKEQAFTILEETLQEYTV